MEASDTEDLALDLIDLALDSTVLVLDSTVLVLVFHITEDLALTALDLEGLDIRIMEGLDLEDSDLVVFTDLSFTIVIMVVDSAVVML